MLKLLLATLAFGGAYGAADGFCWEGGFTAAICCTGPPPGNELCWDASFTYERCCGGADSAEKSVCLSSSCASNSTGFVRGAPPYLQSHYSQADGKFHCMDGDHTSLPLAVVNDEYCDCRDGSDEPGTSACAGQTVKPSLPGFYCRWRQAVSSQHQLVRFSQVNDGICDCCNGEDEWDLEGRGAICPDRCANVSIQNPIPVDASRASQAAHAKRRHAERGSKLSSVAHYSDLQGGDDHAFLAVAEKGCFEQDDGRNFYKFCLFDKVTHRLGSNGRDFILGRGPGTWRQTFWENGQLRNDYTHLTMGQGEWCHRASANRSTEIDFICAPDDAIVSITETSLCNFKVDFETPAVCNANVE